MEIALAILCVAMLSRPTLSERSTTAEANMRVLRNGVVAFEETGGRLPTAAEGLDALIRRPADWPAQVPWSPIIETTDVPRDAWGNAYVYLLNPNLPDGFGIYSRGENGITSSHGNDRDDLNTWDPDRPWAAYYQRSRWTARTMLTAVPLRSLILLAIAAVTALLWIAAVITRHRTGGCP